MCASVCVLSCHYPGTVTTSAALQTSKPLWSSEDFSTFNDDIGAGCLARVCSYVLVSLSLSLSVYLCVCLLHSAVHLSVIYRSYHSHPEGFRLSYYDSLITILCFCQYFVSKLHQMTLVSTYVVVSF